MNTRPQPRISPLAGMSPIDPVVPQPVREPWIDAQPDAPGTRAPAPKTATATSTKCTFRLPSDVMDRARNAVAWTFPHEGMSLSSLAAKAIDDEVTRLESLYNDGQPFPRVGALPPGPRPGEAS